MAHQSVRRWRAAKAARAPFGQEYVKYVRAPSRVLVTLLKTNVVPLLHLVGNTIAAKGAAVKALEVEWNYPHAIMLRSASVGEQWAQCRLCMMLKKRAEHSGADLGVVSAKGNMVHRVRCNTTRSSGG